MRTFAEMGRRLSGLDVMEVASKSIDETKQALMDQQRLQMKDGFLKTGEKISPPYAQSTVSQKRKKGQETGHVTLENTKEFKAMFFVDVRPKSYIIDSAKLVGRGVLLSPFLERMYGPSIWGLGGKYKIDYIASLREAMKINIQQQLQQHA